MIARPKFFPSNSQILILGVVLMITPFLALAQQPEEWKSIIGPDGSFTAEMPGAPVHNEETKKSGGGTSYTSHSYSLDQGSAAFIIQTAVFPTDVDVSVPKKNLQAAIDAVGEVLTEKKWTSVNWVERQGLIAVDGVGTQGQIEVRYFAVMKGAQFLSLVYAGPPGTAKTSKVERFLNSLQIAK